MKNVFRLLPLLILLTQPALGSVVFEFDVDDQSGSEQTSTVTALVAGENLKLEVNDERKNDRTEMIFRGARNEMVVVNHGDKSYMVLDQETLEAIGSQIDSAMQEVKDALAEVPEDQRAMVEKMMQEQLGALRGNDADEGPRVEVKATSIRGEQAGYPCVKHEVFIAGKKQRELWVTDWDRVKGGKQAMDAFKAMASFFEEMMSSFGAAGGFLEDNFDNPFAQMDQLGGFPVLTQELDENGNLESAASLRSATERELDPATFEPPKGYSKRSIL